MEYGHGEGRHADADGLYSRLRIITPQTSCPRSCTVYAGKPSQQDAHSYICLWEMRERAQDGPIWRTATNLSRAIAEEPPPPTTVGFWLFPVEAMGNTSNMDISIAQLWSMLGFGQSCSTWWYSTEGP